MTHTVVNTGIDTLTNWHTSSSGDKRGSTDNHYKDWLNDMRVNFYETADYGLDWAGGGSGVDVETTFPASPSSGVTFIRFNTATNVLRLYSFDGTNWNTIGYRDKQHFFNGTFLESFDAVATSSGGVVTMSLEKIDGGDLTMRFSDGFTTLDCTPAVTIILDDGTDEVPKTNFVYILQSGKVLVNSIVEWPTEEHIRVAFFYLPSAAHIETEGPYITQNWDDHREGVDDQGHLRHITNWIRSQPSKYISGIDGDSATGDDYLDIVTTTAFFVSQAGVTLQLHEHAFPAYDTSISGEDVHVVNDPDSAFNEISELVAGITKLSDNTSIGNNKYFNLVFWGVSNKSGEYHPMMCNLPSKQYTSLLDAQTDVDGGDNFTIPREFNMLSSTGFLLCRLTIQKTISGWVYQSTLDLRGATPQTATGGGTGGAGTDTTAIHDNQLAEISAIANKATPVGADFILIEDSAASDAKKHITITNLEAILIHNNLAGIDAGDVNHLTDAQITALHALFVPAGVTAHTDVSSVGSGAIITDAERTALHAAITTLTHTSLTGKNDETDIKHLTDAQITALHAAFGGAYDDLSDDISHAEQVKAAMKVDGGGTISVDGSDRFNWTQRFIIIANGRGSHFSTIGYFDIIRPTSGTITAVGGGTANTWNANGIVIPAWNGLYYILPIGSTSTSIAANFRMVGYTSDLEIPDHWILIAGHNGDNHVTKVCNGLLLNRNESWINATSSMINTGLLNVVEDTTPQLGGNLDLNDKGITHEFVAGENLTAGNLCYLGDSGRMWKANASTANSTEADTLLAISLDAPSAAATGTFLLFGKFTTTGLSISAEYFVGETDGTITTTRPSTSGDTVRHVGTAISTTVLFFNPDQTYLEIT